MKTYKSFKYRVYPTDAQIARLERWNDALRALWNLAMNGRLMCYGRPKDERLYPTAFDQILDLKDLRANFSWLADVPRDVEAELLMNLDKAWSQCFKKTAKAPKMKRKDRDFLSFCAPSPCIWKLNGSVLRFPKLGNLKTIVDRPLEGKPKTCRLKRDVDQWFAIIECEIKLPDPPSRTTPVVGIDRGVCNLTADSNGLLIENPRFYEQSLRKLQRAQRNVSRKQNGSANQAKAKLRVAKLHRKVRRQRDHFLHTLSTRYAKSHGTIGIENLQVENMTRSGNSGLSRGILDSGWGKFSQMLQYKLEWSGGRLVEVPAAYSSQECSACGYVDRKSRTSQATFCCTGCGYSDHADLNAAKVILGRTNRAVSVPVEDTCSSGIRRSRKLKVSGLQQHMPSIGK